MGHGLRHPADIVAWRRWHEARHPVRHVVRSARARVRPPAESLVDVLEPGGDADLLVAVEAPHASVRQAVVAPLVHLEAPRTAIVAPVGWQPPAVFAAHHRRTVPLSSVARSLRPAAVLAAGHYTVIGEAAFLLAEQHGARFFVSQHGALTPFAPPLPRAAHLLVWSDADAASCCGTPGSRRAPTRRPRATEVAASSSTSARGTPPRSRAPAWLTPLWQPVASMEPPTGRTRPSAT